MKVLHVINSLKKGGAEGNLYKLCEFQKKKYRKKIEIVILTLIDNGYYENKFKNLGIKVFSLKFNKQKKLLDFFFKIIEFRKFIRKQNPVIIQSWMYHSNFLTMFAQKNYFQKLYWNIRHSELSIKISKTTTILVSIICGLFSRIFPNNVIYCSRKSINFHVKYHFYKNVKTKLIYNGYNFNKFFPSKNYRLNFRKKFKIKKTDIILGYAGRFAKQKNIFSMLSGFSKISKVNKNIYLYMVGQGINNNNKKLKFFINQLGLNNRIFLLNHKKNLLEFYNGIDLLLLVSHSESFSNVIAESMLCSTPVLSSNAGCSKKIVEKNGFIINKIDDVNIARNLNKCLSVINDQSDKWKILKKNSRSYIKNSFSIKKMAESYSNVWNFK